MAKAIVLGIDGGGTSTRACLMDEDGSVLGEGNSGPSNYQDVGVLGAKAAIDAAVEEAYSKAAVLRSPAAAAFLGLAAIVNEEEREMVRGIAESLNMAPLSKIEADHDIRIALSGGLAGEPGIALIAGTGSSCFGINGEGKRWQCGGWGSLADDFGSASWLGQRAMQVAVRQADGRLPESGIKKAVMDFLGIGDVLDVLRRLAGKGMPRTQLAKLAPIVASLADGGDQQALQLLREAAICLAELVSVTAGRLSMIDPKVVFAGGVARSPAPFKTLLEGELMRRLPACRITEPMMNPVQGAAMEALGLLGIGFNKSNLGNSQ